MERQIKLRTLGLVAVGAGATALAILLVRRATRTRLEVPPFDWPTTVAEIEEGAAAALDAAAANLDAVAAVPDTEVSFKTVIAPLMTPPNFKTNPLICQSKFLQHCSTDAELRAAAEEAGKKFAAFKADARRRSDVYAKVVAFAASAEAKSLPQYEAHFVQAIVADFERGGLALAPADQTKLQELLDADAECCAKYGANLGNDKTQLRFKPAELEGMPQSFIDERLDAATGEVKVTLKYPDIVPIMSSCEVAETRRAVTVARECAYGNNLEHVARGVQLRKETAELLGYPSWAHYITETRMSGSPEAVHAFMEEITKLAQMGAAACLEELRQAKIKHLQSRGELAYGANESEVKIEAHDTSFYHELILKNEYGVDTEAIREYFPLDNVVSVTLEIYQELLGLVFTEIPKGQFQSWHDEVRLFVVHDAASGARTGHFYMDLHPREGKYGHAAIFHLLKRNGTQTAVDAMMCNLPAPSSDGTSALLRHSDVVTFFHEFGHIMHGLCAEGDGNQTRYAKCPRDFVEAPSQMLENWCWQPSVLARLSKHHQTGEALPQPLIDSMVAAKNVHEAMFMMRQVYLAMLDLSIHGTDPPTTAEGLQELVDTLRPKLTGIANPPNGNMLRNFGHLMNQYSAAYYGYMWAEVISADMFKTRFSEDPMSASAGMAYRKMVLAVGGTGKISDHLKGFLGGRAPDQRAFLKSRGII